MSWRNGWFVVPQRVAFRDLDAMGHVNNAVFLTLFENARILMWFDLTGGSRPEDIGFIVARAEIDFKQQIGLEDLEVRVRIGEMRSSSLDTLYEIRKVSGDEIAATGRVVVVLYDWERQSKMAISDELRRKVAECSRDAS
ncbi:MAG TPA: thioesterase family protein [Thermoanaerobaculia bacterium]|nr:thioesterase family protein [Thermoanaerobaculia bacterium]